MMHVACKVIVKPVSWATHRHQVFAIRRKVFVEEQHVPLELELDEQDHTSQHFLVQVDNRYVATGRLTSAGQIGRMAVLAGFRRRGIGSQLLEAMIVHAKAGTLKKLYLHAQIKAIPFYTQYGFHASGDTFMEAGIAHRYMERHLYV